MSKLEQEITEDTPKFYLHLKSCPRCHEDHGIMTLTKLMYPIVIEGAPYKLTHWAWCETNAEPITLYMTQRKTYVTYSIDVQKLMKEIEEEGDEPDVAR